MPQTLPVGCVQTQASNFGMDLLVAGAYCGPAQLAQYSRYCGVLCDSFTERLFWEGYLLLLEP